MEELKPCPFCGGEAKIFTPTISTYIMCKECKASTNLYSQSEEAIEAWNRRANAAVEVVRCKDCIYASFYPQKLMYECGRYADVLMFPDDFCSYGKRRGE